MNSTHDQLMDQLADTEQLCHDMDRSVKYAEAENKALREDIEARKKSEQTMRDCLTIGLSQISSLEAEVERLTKLDKKG